MGVEAKTIVMVGVNINNIDIEDDLRYDLIDKYSEFDNSITYIDDGMSGEYLYVGKVLAYSEDVYDSLHVELEFIPEHTILEVKSHLFETLGIVEEPKIIVFNHIY